MQVMNDPDQDLAAQGQKWRAIYNEAKRRGDWDAAELAGQQLHMNFAIGQSRARKRQLARIAKAQSNG